MLTDLQMCLNIPAWGRSITNTRSDQVWLGLAGSCNLWRQSLQSL